MEILEAFDATGCAHSAAQLAGVDPKTVQRYVDARDAGRPVDGGVSRPKLIDAFMQKVEEWVERSEGKVRADVIHERLTVLGFTGDERTTRRAVAVVKATWDAGHRRTYRPWITEPGLWLQFDWGYGPLVPGPDGARRRTLLFCAWLARSRFRVVIPTWDRTLGTLISCLDRTLRVIDGAAVIPPPGAGDDADSLRQGTVIAAAHTAYIVAAGGIAGSGLRAQVPAGQARHEIQHGGRIPHRPGRGALRRPMVGTAVLGFVGMSGSPLSHVGAGDRDRTGMASLEGLNTVCP